MTENLDKTLELLKSVFEADVAVDVYLEGFFSGKATKYLIQTEKIEAIVKDFPFMANAIRAGLFLKDKKSGKYYTTDRIMAVKSNDKRKSRAKQFFSINGDDDYERTTLYDILQTISNLKYVSKKFGVATDEIKFTLRHENGNPNKVVNYVELDKRLFGNNEEEIVSNISKLNSMVKYERKQLNEEKSNVA